MDGPRVPEHALRHGVLAGIALLMAAPLVVTPGTLFPFVLGKALWSRVIIEIVFAMWVWLAVANPRYRPPRSWLLVGLGLGLGVALLAGGFGVSFQRSLWSTYQRMTGVVDLAHWFALALVLTGTLRTAAAWRGLLSVNLGVGAVVACLAIARYHQWAVPFYGLLGETDFPRIGGALGNPNWLSAYLLVNTGLALGFLARSCLPGTPPAPQPRRGARKRARSPWMGRCLWAGLAALQFWGFILADSVGGFVGLLGSVGFLAAAGAFFGRGRRRGAAIAAIAVLGTAAVLFGLRATDPDRRVALRLDTPVLQHLAGVHLQRTSVQSRLSAWEAGVEGFLDRPLLGWGPGNYQAAFGRFGSGYAATGEPHDRAHSKLVEVAATTGVVGLAHYLAIWSLTFLVVLRAAARMQPRQRWFVLFVGATLTGALVQNQFLFDTTTALLQYTVLLGFVVGLEPAAFSGVRPRLPLAAARQRLRGRKAARVAVAVAASALAATGLSAHRAMYAAANAQHVAAQPRGSTGIEEAIDGFRPMANLHRWLLFQDFARQWPKLRAERGEGARGVLQWVDAQAAEGLRTEPESWRLQHSLARMYRAVASTEPDYETQAQRHLARARELAPNRAVFPVALIPPQPLGSRQREDGRRELHWKRSHGTAYHQVGIRVGYGNWRTIRYVYDPGVTSFVVPAADEESEDTAYGIKACARPDTCSDWTAWPPMPVPAPRGPAGAPRSHAPPQA